MRVRRLALGLAVATIALAAPQAALAAAKVDLWKTYQRVFAKTRYISLSHVIAPRIPVWKGFGPSVFGPAVDPTTGSAYTYAKDGFEATSYELATDQLGTQLDPPAHWDPHYPAIDELPPTYSVRPLAVISIVRQVRARADYHLRLADVRAWERRHGRLPAGSVVMVRSDWSQRWPDPALMHHGYTQAEGVANLDKVPAKGCLISIGFPRFKGGVGGYASYTAICPPGWRHDAKVSGRDAPLPRSRFPLHWDARAGFRIR
jgi:kynurenine formamidase